MENLAWYKDLDWSMIWMCLGATVLVVLSMEIQRERDMATAKTKLSGVGNYFIPTWKNYLFQLLASLVMLGFISEIATPIVDFAITKINALFSINIEFRIESAEELAHTLAAFSGLGGGFIIAKIIKKIQK